MSEMIERVAKAIEDADANGFSKLPYWACARAAIEAMREPTEAMADAGTTETNSEEDAIECWNAMIAEALK